MLISKRVFFRLLFLGPVHMNLKICKIIILFAKCSNYLAIKYANLQTSVTLFAHVNAAL